MPDLTDAQCDDFRRMPGSFNDMVRAIYRAGAAPWIPCSERLPVAHGIFLCYWPSVEQDGGRYQGCITSAFYDNDDKRFSGEYHGPASVTHWQPLPTPP